MTSTPDDHTGSDHPGSDHPGSDHPAADHPAADHTGSDHTVLDGPALENEEMRRGTQDLQSSEAKIDQAREHAHDVARATEPAAERSGPS